MEGKHKVVNPNFGGSNNSVDPFKAKKMIEITPSQRDLDEEACWLEENPAEPTQEARKPGQREKEKWAIANSNRRNKLKKFSFNFLSKEKIEKKDQIPHKSIG